MSAKTSKLVTLGRICGIHGVQGWVKVYSYTEPRDNILRYDAWILDFGAQRCRMEVEAGRSHGKNVLAKLRGVNDREQASEWIGAQIAVSRDCLPRCGPDEYYWVDLEGLEVRTVNGESLGAVDYVLATGAHDVLVLSGAGEHLIPFVLGDVIRDVDLDAGVIVANWPADFSEQ